MVIAKVKDTRIQGYKPFAVTTRLWESGRLPEWRKVIFTRAKIVSGRLNIWDVA
jgi:hypothetical protein